MSTQDEGDKSHEPSARKLDEARKKGEIARSTDIISASSFAGFLIAFTFAGVAGVQTIGSAFMTMIAQSQEISTEMIRGGAFTLTGSFLAALLSGVGIWFALPISAAILSIFAQRAFLFTPSKLRPKLSRISPISGAKNKFGISGLFEFLKSLGKLVIFTTALGFFLVQSFPRIAESLQQEPAVVLLLLGELTLDFILVVVLVMGAFGVIDYFWQRHRHLVKNRMSQKELKDEHKEAEGDPHLKQERRARAQQAASTQMMADVKTADVVIVNPTHYSVALKWSREPGSVPICVAKGMDEVALRIREIAAENAVPIHADPPTARALHGCLKVGDVIHQEHFRAVAFAIRFAEEMRRKARKYG